jgi:hypothetical protein
MLGCGGNANLSLRADADGVLDAMRLKEFWSWLMATPFGPIKAC